MPFLLIGAMNTFFDTIQLAQLIHMFGTGILSVLSVVIKDVQGAPWYIPYHAPPNTPSSNEGWQCQYCSMYGSELPHCAASIVKDKMRREHVATYTLRHPAGCSRA